MRTDAVIYARASGAVHRWLLIPLLVAAALLAGCERPPVESVQRGYRGTGMDQIYNPRTLAEQAPRNALPADTPIVPAVGPTAGATFKNVRVLQDLSVGEFTRLMVSMTAWVAPQQGCTYCHAPGADFSADDLYSKVVARRMLQMTQHINADWKAHVADTGVTCYTCHRGQPVPENIWFKAPPQGHDASALGGKAGQNMPSTTVGLASLPYDPFTPFLLQTATTNDIRVIGKSALPNGNRQSIKQAEWTYGLMVHMSESLGVNCTFCHNSRSFAEWDTSTPQRATAWYGIRMARDLNEQYLSSLAGVFPANRLGPLGDVPKVDCATCHQGAFKPLYGANLLANHPELGKVRTSIVAPASSAASAPQAAATPSVEILFDVGSAALSDAGSKSLATMIAALNANPAAKVVVSGFHSASGDQAQNEALAKQRAMTVQAALKAGGVADERIVLEKPQTAEANLSGEDPKARRVDVAVK